LRRNFTATAIPGRATKEAQTRQPSNEPLQQAFDIAIPLSHTLNCAVKLKRAEAFGHILTQDRSRRPGDLRPFTTIVRSIG
jgi:hypothetical protein